LVDEGKKNVEELQVVEKGRRRLGPGGGVGGARGMRGIKKMGERRGMHVELREGPTKEGKSSG
jgi:hypothetical protein